MAFISDPKAPAAPMVAVLEAIKAHCKETPVKLLVGNNGGLAVLLAGCERFSSPEALADPALAAVTVAAFEALCGLLFEQPDLAGPVQVCLLDPGQVLLPWITTHTRPLTHTDTAGLVTLRLCARTPQWSR